MYFLICVNNDPKKTIDSNTRDKNAEVDGDNENDVENGHLNDTFFYGNSYKDEYENEGDGENYYNNDDETIRKTTMTVTIKTATKTRLHRGRSAVTKT